jgi:hypothetical protein
MIIAEPREHKKGKKGLDHEVVLEKSSGNRESHKITIKSSRFGGLAQTPVDKQKLTTHAIIQKGQLGQL